MSLRRLLAALLMFAASAAVAQERFVNRDLNFSVATPAAEWKWERLSAAAGVWLVTDARGERFSVTVSPPGKMSIDEQWIFEMIRFVQRDAQAHAEKIEGFRFSRRTAPIYPSFTYAYERVTADGRRSYVDGYVAAVGRVYALQYASGARTAMTEFRTFVDSFQVADKFESQRAGRAAGAAQTMQSMISALGAPVGRVVAPNTEVIVH
ncbi:MAG TPA: hypothetical protein VJ276_12765 [Thermoanaerobaculia bacterium]|nr:hypothetical protein [Thermoanaerobaculia bacterium]